MAFNNPNMFFAKCLKHGDATWDLVRIRIKRDYSDLHVAKAR